MYNFDRGLIKWLPFDALTGFKKAIIELKRKRLKRERPILSEDQNEILNNKLKIVLEYKLTCNIYYYKNGYIEYISGNIKKIDLIKKAIFIEKEQIEVEDILEIEEYNQKYDYESFIG